MFVNNTDILHRINHMHLTDSAISLTELVC